MNNRTFTMIKPDATQKGYTGAILDQIEKQDFDVFRKRARTNIFQKIIISIKTYLWYRKNM